MSLRLSLCLNSGARCGKPQAAVVVVPEPATLLKAAVNKLRLSKKDQAKVRFFVWSTGHELLSDGSGYAQLKNGDMVAISFGESYAGPVGSTCHHALPFESAQAHAGGSTNGSSNGSSNDAAIDGSSIGPADPPRDAIACDLKALGMIRWESVSASLAIVEWSESSRMNASLGRMRQASVFYPCLATFLAYGHSLFTHAWPHFWPMATVVWPQLLGHSCLATVFWPQCFGHSSLATGYGHSSLATVYGHSVWATFSPICHSPRTPHAFSRPCPSPTFSENRSFVQHLPRASDTQRRCRRLSRAPTDATLIRIPRSQSIL